MELVEPRVDPESLTSSCCLQNKQEMIPDLQMLVSLKRLRDDAASEWGWRLFYHPITRKSHLQWLWGSNHQAILCQSAYLYQEWVDLCTELDGWITADMTCTPSDWGPNCRIYALSHVWWVIQSGIEPATSLMGANDEVRSGVCRVCLRGSDQDRKWESSMHTNTPWSTPSDVISHRQVSDPHCCAWTHRCMLQ